MSHESQGDPYGLPELLAADYWQRLQDHFAEVLGVGLRTVTADRTLFIDPSWPAGLDAQKLTTSLALGDELDELLRPGNLPRDTVTTTTPVGLSFSICPLRATPDRIVGYLVVGPVVLGRREDPEQFRSRVATLGLDPQAVWPLMLTVKVYSFGGMRSLLRLLEDVTTTVLELANQSRALRSIVNTPKVEQALARYYMERLAQSMLEVAMAATQAEGGSVMLYDRSRQTLQISAALGLDASVLEGTRVPRGMGIAGRVASGRRVVLLDDRTTDEELRGLMTRHDLVSSLVAPLISELDQPPLGVLNLRTSDPTRRFTQEHVELLRRLTQLAATALVGFHLSLGQIPPPAAA